MNVERFAVSSDGDERASVVGFAFLGRAGLGDWVRLGPCAKRGVGFVFLGRDEWSRGHWLRLFRLDGARSVARGIGFEFWGRDGRYWVDWVRFFRSREAESGRSREVRAWVAGRGIDPWLLDSGLFGR